MSGFQSAPCHLERVLTVIMGLWMRVWPWVWLVLGHMFTLNIVGGKQFATFKKMKFFLLSMCPKYAEDFGFDRIHFITNLYVVLSKIMI